MMEEMLRRRRYLLTETEGDVVGLVVGCFIGLVVGVALGT